MNITKKPVAILSAAAVAGLIVAAISTPVSAKTTALVVNTNDSKTLEYNFNDLKASAVQAALGNQSGATLYNHFIANKVGIKDYYDDVKKAYVDADVVNKAALDAAFKGTDFSLDTFTEATTTPTTTVTPDKVSVGTDGKIDITPADPSKQVVSVSAINLTTGVSTVPTLPTTVKATLGNGTTVDAKITWDATATTAATYATAGTVTVNGTLADYNNYKVSATVTVNGQLTVSSVSAVNQKMIQVTFNKEVDKTSAIAAANYKIDGAALNVSDYVVFGSDKKSVTIYLNSALNQDQKINVAVTGILDASTYAKMTDYNQDITVRDTANPTLLKAELKDGNKSLYLTFSEALDSANITDPGSYTINGQALSTFGATAAAFDQAASTDTSAGVAKDTPNVVKITFANGIPTGSYTVAIKENKLKDPAAFFATNQSTQFTSVADTTSLSVVSTTATTGTPGTIEVKFNKDLGTLIAGYTVNGGTSRTPSLKTGTKDTIVLSQDTVAEGANVVVIPAAQKDAYGNKIGDTDLRISVTGAKDTIKPTVQSVYAITDKKVRIKFNKNVNVAPFVSAKANYTIKDSTGAVVYSSTVDSSNYTITPNADGDNTLVDVTFANALPGSNYTIEIKGVKDGAGNEMEAWSTTFVSPDKTAPTLLTPGSKAVANATDNTVEIFFSEAMDSSTITNKANYLYKTTGDFGSLPTSATLEAGTANKSVKITFPSTVGVGSITDINVLSVKDVAGNLISGGVQATGAPRSTLGVNPKVVEGSAKVVADSDKVTVTFDTDKQITAIAAANFASCLTGGSIGSDAPDTATVSGKTITLTYLSTNANYAKIKAAGKSVSLAASFTAANTKDAYGDALTTTGVTADGLKVTDGIAPELVASNPIKVATANTITLDFNEAISNENLGELKDDVVVTTAGAYTTIDSAAVSGSGSTVTLTTHDALSGTVTLTLASDKISMKDVAGNVFVPTTANKNQWKIDLTGTPASAAVKTADDVLGASVGFDTATKITLGTTDVTLTNVKSLGATYDAATNIDTVVAKLQADIDAVTALNGKYVVSKGTAANAGKLVITSVATGTSANVDLTGSDVATGATLLGFTTLTSVPGGAATPLTAGNFAQ